MIVLSGLFLLLLLGIAALQAKKLGIPPSRIALFAFAGAAFILIATFVILAWGFSGFG